LATVGRSWFIMFHQTEIEQVISIMFYLLSDYSIKGDSEIYTVLAHLDYDPEADTWRQRKQCWNAGFKICSDLGESLGSATELVIGSGELYSIVIRFLSCIATVSGQQHLKRKAPRSA
jgi:hypothetical protein